MSKTTIPTAGLADAAVTTAKITDANITTAKIADDAVTSAKSTAGITMADQWRLTTDFTGDANPIASNWERNDNASYSSLGTGMTESSGIFTFPATGIYMVTFNVRGYDDSDGNYNEAEINVTTNNSSYVIAASMSQFVQQTSSTSGTINMNTSTIIDVTNVSNVKFNLSHNVADNGFTTQGNTAQNRTFATIIRLGDT